MEENLLRKYLNKVKSKEADGMHPERVRGILGVIAGSLVIIFNRSWQMLETSEDWKTANVTPVFRKNRNAIGRATGQLASP